MISLNLVEVFGLVEHLQRHTHTVIIPTLITLKTLLLDVLSKFTFYLIFHLEKSINILLKLTGIFPPSNKPLTLSPDRKKKAKPFKKKKKL